MKMFVVPGNNIGSYSVPQIAAGDKLLVGFALNGNPSIPNDNGDRFNFAPLTHMMVSDAINGAPGWIAAAGLVIDPTITDWSDYTLVWLYE